MKKTFQILISLIFLLAGLNFISCDEDKNPQAIVKVVKVVPDSSGNPSDSIIVNARVWFNPPENASLDDIVDYVDVPKLTDINGEAVFETSHEAIIEILTEGEDKNGKTLHGEGVIVLLKNEVYYERIELN